MRLVRRGGYERVLFVGDDDTDEDVFRFPAAVPLLGVAVGRRRQSAASYYLRRQGDVARLLSVLERLRAGWAPLRVAPLRGQPRRDAAGVRPSRPVSCYATSDVAQ